MSLKEFGCTEMVVGVWSSACYRISPHAAHLLWLHPGFSCVFLCWLGSREWWLQVKHPALPASRLCFPVCSSHVGVHPSGPAEGGWGLRHYYYLTPLCICCGRNTHMWPMPGAHVCGVRAARGIKSNCSSFVPSRSSHRPHCLQSLCAVMLACVAQLTA